MNDSLSIVPIPADIPQSMEQEYLHNYAMITKNSGRLMLFAADQKIEHLNNDFYGDTIAADALNPEHLFTIAKQGVLGAFATHVGLITRYGRLYPNIPYIAKLNGKTDLLSKYQDPISQQLWTLEDVLVLKKNGLNITGIGYTIYLGSEHEPRMLAQAAQALSQAHHHGLVTILWVYARGKHITDDRDPQLLAGATGLAHALGADFVKIKVPQNMNDLATAVHAAGNTKVICSGGSAVAPATFLHDLYTQLQHGAAGCATGRNIFQKSLPHALAFTQAIAAMVYEGVHSDTALDLYQRSITK